MHPGFPLGPDHAVDLVSGALAAIEPHAVTGLHCCGVADGASCSRPAPRRRRRPFDAGLEDAAGTLGAFLDRGGRAAGAGATTAARHHRHRLLAPPERACARRPRSAATRSPASRRRSSRGLRPRFMAIRGGARAVAEPTVAQRLHDQAMGVRLSAGA